MVILNNVRLPLDTDFSDLPAAVGKLLHLSRTEAKSVRLFRKSVDARHKSNIHFCCSLLINPPDESNLLKRLNNAQPYTPAVYQWPQASIIPQQRPVIAGFGPAGMFAALVLARAGLRPIILERGRNVDRRTADIQQFFKGGLLNPESNVQFGEGGAGTFSDGKLNTGIKDTRCRTVLESFVSFGAPKEILTDAKPHIGTDILVTAVKNLRTEVQRLGGEIRFESRLDGLDISNGQLCGITVNGELMPCNRLILATGHSARDTFELIKKYGIPMIRKPFAMGVRIEHLQKDIDHALYGDFAGHPALKPADYKLAVHLTNGRGVYTFCMCPGGEVINSSSEYGRTAVNGMSYSHRNGINANSAVLVNVDPEDLPGEDVLAGCLLQRTVEENAYRVGKGAVPVTDVGFFLNHRPDQSGKITPTVKPEAVHTDFDTIFPGFITAALREGIPLLDRKLNGFADPAAILTAPETRSSSPVRLLRSDNGQSTGLAGLFPTGEGAGYAGGIMSAAVDGMHQAEALITSLRTED